VPVKAKQTMADVSFNLLQVDVPSQGFWKYIIKVEKLDSVALTCCKIVSMRYFEQ